MLAAGHKGGRVRVTVESSSPFWGNKDYVFHVLIGFLFLFLFWLHQAACRILVPQPGIGPLPSRNEGTSPGLFEPLDLLHFTVYIKSSSKTKSFFLPLNYGLLKLGLI